ncbi:hypothetical protein [Klebsiella michiganensis]
MKNEKSLDAWMKFLKIGGIEPLGRDKDFVQSLKKYLNPTAITIEEAVLSSTTDMLVRGLFSGVTPFSAMIKEIMYFFCQASTKYGKNQWEIGVSDDFLDLKDFQNYNNFLEKTQRIINIPNLDYKGSWCVCDIAKQFETINENLQKAFHNETIVTGLDDVDNWLYIYFNNHQYIELPQTILSLLEDKSPLAELSSLCMIVYENIKSRWASLYSLKYDINNYNFPVDNALSIDTIVRNETDLWLGKTIIIIASAIRLETKELNEFKELLREQFLKYQYINYSLSTDSVELEKILSFPVWKKRHELYAIWIATEINSALREHNIEIYTHTHDNKLTFPFKETLIATVHSSIPILKIYSEKYEELDSPKGKGRHYGVQPDYSLWQEKNHVLYCPLVIEVKHYKRNSRRIFSDALEDYASAHPDAEILLINHGPVSDMLDNVDCNIKKRCLLIGEYNALSTNKRVEFYSKINKIAGPINTITPFLGKEGMHGILLIDVSSSMRDIINNDDFNNLLTTLTDIKFLNAALIDTSITDFFNVGEIEGKIRSAQYNKGTDLNNALAHLPENYNRITLLTDSEGKDQICESNNNHYDEVSISEFGDNYFILNITKKQTN